MTGSQTLQNLRSRMLRLPGLAIMVVAVLILGVVLILSTRSAVPTVHAANIVVDSALDTAHVSDLDGNGANNGAEVAETVCGIGGIPTAPTGVCTLRAALYVASSNFPRFDINPNTGEPMGRHTHQEVARNTVHFGPEYPSRITLPIIPAG